DGRQYLYHRTGSAVLTARGPAITTDRGGCAGTGLRPLIAAPATSNGAPALVYSVTDGFLPCDQATLVLRPVNGGADVFLASGVRGAAVAGANKVVFIRGKLLFSLELDGFTETQLSATGSDFAGQLVFASAGTAWTLQPGTGVLTSFDLSGGPTAGTPLPAVPSLVGAKGGYALAAAELAVEAANGAILKVDTTAGTASTLLAPATVGATRLLLGVGNN
ncbi:MAG: hypothetical protein ACK4N5_03730, partial [Myxococcales bacterium]